MVKRVGIFLLLSVVVGTAQIPMQDLCGMILARPISTAAGQPSDPHTKLLLHFNGTNLQNSFVDSSIYSNAITVSAGPIVSTTNSVFGGGAMYRNTGALIIPASTNFDLTGDFTLEAWAYIKDYQLCVMSVVTDPNGWLGPRQSSYAFGMNYDWNTGVDLSPTNVSFNAWHHIAISRASGVIRLFVNGKQTGANQSNSSALSSAGHDMWVGRTQPANSGFVSMDGFLDEVRLSDVARWTNNFTPPTVEYTP